MARCFVGLGANQGQPQATFERVRQSLESLTKVSLCSSSSSYLSRAMGVHAGEDFFNAVVEIQTSFTPFELLAELQSIEAGLGRLRGTRWGPRLIDLDLLYFDNLNLASKTLILPHPHAWYRRFVLEPMCEIASDFLHPVYSQTQQQLLQRIDQTPFRVEILGTDMTLTEIDRLQIDFPGLEIKFVSVPDAEAALVISRQAVEDATLPTLSLETVPAKNADDALRSILEACRGHCRRVD